MRQVVGGLIQKTCLNKQNSDRNSDPEL